MHSAEAMCQTPPTVADERPTALLADLGAETPGLMEARFSRGSVDLPGCSFCCGSSTAANSAGAQGWSRLERPEPARSLRARTNDLDQTEHRQMIGDGGTAAPSISGGGAQCGVVGGFELDRRDVPDRPVEPMVVEPP